MRCGVRKTRSASKQLYQCKGCLRRFSNENPSGCRTPPHVIRRTLSLACQDYTYFYYYSFDPSPDLIGLPGAVAPQAAVSPPRAVHPTIHPEGKRPDEKSSGVPSRLNAEGS